MAVFALEYSGLFDPLSRPKNLKQIERAEDLEECVPDFSLRNPGAIHEQESLCRMAVERLMDSEG